MTATSDDLVTTWQCSGCEVYGSDTLGPDVVPSCWACGQPATVLQRNIPRPAYAPGIYTAPIGPTFYRGPGRFDPHDVPISWLIG